MTRSISFASLNHFGLQLQPAQQANRSRSSVYRCSREGRQRDGRCGTKTATPQTLQGSKLYLRALARKENQRCGTAGSQGRRERRQITRDPKGKAFLTPA